MTREEKIHWLENIAFENGGVVEVKHKTPIAFDRDRCDFVNKLTFFMGEELMVGLEMRDIAVPISKLKDESVNSLFKEFCLDR